ncbi:MAG: FHA domain-containing protein [Chloroflexota bacterium]
MHNNDEPDDPDATQDTRIVSEPVADDAAASPPEEQETRSIKDYLEPPDIQGRWGTSNLRKGTILAVEILAPVAATLEFEVDDMVVLSIGRVHAAEGVAPDIDMSTPGFAEAGISRRHAVIEKKDNWIVLRDLGSKNGTYLNGIPLVPNQPRVLRNGDEVRFGLVKTRVTFIQP